MRPRNDGSRNRVRVLYASILSSALLLSFGTASANESDPPEITQAEISRYTVAKADCHLGGYSSEAWLSVADKHVEVREMAIHQPVYLLPDIPFVRWWLPQFADGGGAAPGKFEEDTVGEHLPDELSPLTKKLKTDERGLFFADNIPCERYIVLYVDWMSVPRNIPPIGDPQLPTRVWDRDLEFCILQSRPTLAAREITAGVARMKDAHLLFNVDWRGAETIQ